MPVREVFDVEPVSARAVAECTSEEVADAFTRSFEQYLVPVSVTARAYERRFRAEHLDPFASRVFYSGGTPAGVLLVARRGWTARVAAVGVVPGLRGRGLGRQIMEGALADARGRGDRAVTLEVIEGNDAALALYTRLGFRRRRRLVGYRLAPDSAAAHAADALTEIDPLEFARRAAAEGDQDLPWMIAAETFAAATAPARAYRLGGCAYALVGNAESETLPLAGLVVSREGRRRGWGTRMLRALRASYAGRSWAVQPVVPEDFYPDLFARAGWERQSLTQFEMRAELA